MTKRDGVSSNEGSIFLYSLLAMYPKSTISTNINVLCITKNTKEEKHKYITSHSSAYICKKF